MGSENDASEGLRRRPRLNTMIPQPVSLPSQPKPPERVPLPSQPKPERVPLPSQPEEPQNDQPKRSTRFTPTERDLESDEAVWALYEKWCIHHDRQRAHEDMQRRFDHFKESAKQAVELNKNHTFSYDLNRWSDEYPDGRRFWMSGIVFN